MYLVFSSSSCYFAPESILCASFLSAASLYFEASKVEEGREGKFTRECFLLRLGCLRRRHVQAKNTSRVKQYCSVHSRWRSWSRGGVMKHTVVMLSAVLNGRNNQRKLYGGNTNSVPAALSKIPDCLTTSTYPQICQSKQLIVSLAHSPMNK